MKRVVAATRNPHKLIEIRRILSDVPHLDLVGPEAVGLAPDPAEEQIEIFDTFEENAAAKARWFGERSGLPALADDSGLEVDALNGAPGVRSKRFSPGSEERSGDALDRRNNDHLLDLLEDLPLAERTARFVCVAALCTSDGDIRIVRGESEGLILGRPRGTGGFGYDPLFLHRDLGKTFAELDRDRKAAVGHRGRAFRAMARELRTWIGSDPHG